MNRLKLGLIGLVALVTVIVVFQNTETVTTQVLFVSFEMPRAALLFLTLVVGYLLGMARVDRLLRRRR